MNILLLDNDDSSSRHMPDMDCNDHMIRSAIYQHELSMIDDAGL
jgi:hypothetical protein